MASPYQFQSNTGAVVTPWTAYTPTLTGFGTASNLTASWMRVGGTLYISVFFTSGTSTAVEARCSLPPGLTSASSIPTISLVGIGVFSINSSPGTILCEPSVDYVTFGAQGAAATGLTKLNGDAYLSSGQSMSFNASIQIAGWA